MNEMKRIEQSLEKYQRKQEEILTEVEALNDGIEARMEEKQGLEKLPQLDHGTRMAIASLDVQIARDNLEIAKSALELIKIEGKEEALKPKLIKFKTLLGIQ